MTGKRLRSAGLLAALFLVVAGIAAASTLDRALIAAAQRGNTEHVRQLLAQGANPNAANTDGNTLTALIVASRGGHAGAVELLLKAGAKVDATASIVVGANGATEGITPLMAGAASGDVRTVELLLAHHADPNAASVSNETDDSGAVHVTGHLPVLFQAANFAVLKLLVEHGADVHAKDDNGNTILMHAAEDLDSAAVAYLLSKGCDPDEKNKNGQTAFDLATRAGKTDNAQLLKGTTH